MIKAGVEEAEPRLAIRDPYIFEFLGLRSKDAAVVKVVQNGPSYVDCVLLPSTPTPHTKVSPATV